MREELCHDCRLPRFPTVGEAANGSANGPIYVTAELLIARTKVPLLADGDVESVS